MEFRRWLVARFVRRARRMYVHLTVKARSFLLETPAVAAFAWEALRRAFPLAVAVCVMGNHLHVVVWVDDPKAAWRRFVGVCGAIGAFAGVGEHGWHPVPEPEPVRDAAKLDTAVRYVALNPCRARAAADPLDWFWSTHRDVVGASTDPWVTADRLADALGKPRAGFAKRHHAWVSDDKSVRIGGTPFPESAPPSAFPAVPLVAIAKAACLATRSPPAALKRRSDARRLFVLLAAKQGWDRPGPIAEFCDMHPRTAWRLAREPDRGLLLAGRLTLGDARLMLGVRAQIEIEVPARVRRRRSS